MSNNYLQSAFDGVCKDAKETGVFYVCLVEVSQFYGGPEEGGWWGTDTHVVAYQAYPTEELAEAAAERVKVLAEELKANAQRDFGNQCLREMEWLDARGLDADFLPEPDGHSDFRVGVYDEIPQPTQGDRQYS